MSEYQYRRLIDTGEANVNGDRDQIGCTALHIASYRGYLEISELLTSSGADVNIRDVDESLSTIVPPNPSLIQKRAYSSYFRIDHTLYVPPLI